MICAFDELRLDLLDAALDEALLLARGVILGVFAQVAVRARLGDRLDDARPLLGLQPLAAPRAALRAPRAVMRRSFHAAASAVQVLQPVHVDVVEVVDGVAGRERGRERRVVGDPVCTASRRIECDSRMACLPSVVFTISAISSFLIMSTMCGRPSRTLLARRQAIPPSVERLRGAVGRDDLEALLDQLVARARRRPACRARAR